MYSIFFKFTAKDIFPATLDADTYSANMLTFDTGI